MTDRTKRIAYDLMAVSFANRMGIRLDYARKVYVDDTLEPPEYFLVLAGVFEEFESERMSAIMKRLLPPKSDNSDASTLRSGYAETKEPTEHA